MSEEMDLEPEVDEIDTVLVEDENADAPVDSPALITPSDEQSTLGAADGILTVPIEVVVSVGTAQPLIKDFLNMRRDSLIVLDSKIDDPVEIRVAGRTIARGELQEVADEDGVLAVRLTEVVSRGE
ncbi:MAG: FliM/FliN family flagellar motor switch protein [Pseudomonadota bacterium]